MNEAKRLKLAPPTLTPILADDLCEETPLIDVYVATIIDPKTISQVVVQLNSVLPIPELVHLKRVRGKQILLFPKENDSLDVISSLKAKGFDTSLIFESVKVCTAAKIAPKTRKQYDRVHKFWPCNFHSNSYLEKLTTNTLFRDEELHQHAKFMKIAIDICRLSSQKCGVVVVDPVINSIVAYGFDQKEDYPIKHAVMVAIDNVAKTQNGGVWKDHHLYPKIDRFLRDKYDDCRFDLSNSEEGPYLCTRYSVYSTCEPCIMCAMALVHSRAKRVFYGVASENGGLGGLCKVHVVENLNHHYEAFAGLLENECRLL